MVLLPEKDGRQTAVAVKQGEKEVVLDQPYAATKRYGISDIALVRFSISAKASRDQ